MNKNKIQNLFFMATPGLGAFCRNNVGGYTCLCRSGFRENTSSTGKSTKCIDIDECLKQNFCQGNTECHNTEGSFSCDCVDGYEGDLCEDIDECTSQGSP